MARIANLLNDVAFKYVFSQETVESKEGLKGLLSIFLEQEVKDVTLKNTELVDPDLRVKTPRLDLVVELDDGTSVDVEMQVSYDSKEFGPRMEFYYHKLFISQETKGKYYEELKPCYVITFLNGIIHPDQEEFYNRYSLQNQYHRSFYPKESNEGGLIVVEMPKVNQNKPIEEMDAKEKMIYYFLNCQKGMEDSKIKEMVEKDQVMKMIDKQVSDVTEDRWVRLNREFDELRRNELEMAQKKKMKKMIEEAEAKAKNDAKLEMARNLKSIGISDEDISKASGLSLEEIKNL